MPAKQRHKLFINSQPAIPKLLIGIQCQSDHNWLLYYRKAESISEQNSYEMMLQLYMGIWRTRLLKKFAIFSFISSSWKHTFCLQHQLHGQETHQQIWQEKPILFHRDIHRWTFAICLWRLHIYLPANIISSHKCHSRLIEIHRLY